jgi:hypothetical protein
VRALLGPPAEDEALARFQAALLELFAAESQPERVLARLRADPAFAEFRDYVTEFSPKLIAAALRLHEKWGIRGPTEAEKKWRARREARDAP